MRLILILAGSSLLAASANAQLLGGRAAVGGAAGVQPGTVGSTLDAPIENSRGVVGGATDAAGAAAGDVTGAAGRTVRAAGDGGVVRVKAGARVRATRETRCYDGVDYYDPYYGPDGYYYCESSGPGAAAGASVGVGGR